MAGVAVCFHLDWKTQWDVALKSQNDGELPGAYIIKITYGKVSGKWADWNSNQYFAGEDYVWRKYWDRGDLLVSLLTHPATMRSEPWQTFLLHGQILTGRSRNVTQHEQLGTIDSYDLSHHRWGKGFGYRQIFTVLPILQHAEQMKLKFGKLKARHVGDTDYHNWEVK